MMSKWRCFPEIKFSPPYWCGASLCEGSDGGGARSWKNANLFSWSRVVSGIVVGHPKWRLDWWWGPNTIWPKISLFWSSLALSLWPVVIMNRETWSRDTRARNEIESCRSVVVVVDLLNRKERGTGHYLDATGVEVEACEFCGRNGTDRN